MTKLTKINKFHRISKCSLKFQVCLSMIKTKTQNVLDKGRGEIPFPEKWDYTTQRFSIPHHRLCPFVYCDRAQSRTASQYFSADRNETPDTSSAFSLPVCTTVLLLLQNTIWYFTSLSMLYISSFIFFKGKWKKHTIDTDTKFAFHHKGAQNFQRKAIRLLRNEAIPYLVKFYLNKFNKLPKKK